MGITNRYVSSDQTPRASSRFQKSLKLIFFFVFFCPFLLAENFSLKVQSYLYKFPSEDSEIFGTLPKGTQCEFLNDKQSNFIKVRVELEDDEVLEGWVLEAASSKKLAVDPKKRKLKIPKDEALLLYREPTFFYGIQLGPNLGFVTHAQLSSVASGLGVTVGPLIGTYLTSQFPIHAEANFVMVNGGMVNVNDLRFNYFEVGVVPSVQIQRYEISLGIFYALGLGTTELPVSMQLAGGATDLNSVVLAAGGGFHFNWGIVDSFVSLRYRIHVLTDPYVMQTINLAIAFQLKG